MSMNHNKVKAFINAKIEEYKPYYEESIFLTLKTDVYSGSFGRCFVSLDCVHFALNDRYCSNYNEVEATISEFVIKAHERIAERFYYDHKQEQKAHPMSATLTIFQDGEQVNTFTFNTLEKAERELVKIFVSKEKRKVKTRIYFKPYSEDLQVIQYFPKESNGTTHNYKYVYEFKGVNF